MTCKALDELLWSVRIHSQLLSSIWYRSSPETQEKMKMRWSYSCKKRYLREELSVPVPYELQTAVPNDCRTTGARPLKHYDTANLLENVL